MIQEIPLPLTLYRVDENKPPKNWDRSWSNTSHFGVNSKIKNTSGYFYFTDSIDIARAYGESYKKTRYYLTECTTLKNLLILDFSYCKSVCDMIHVLNEAGINILTKHFKTYEEADENYLATFEDLRSYYDNPENEKKDYIKNEIKLMNLSVFGQRLTDFDNGEHFLSAIRSASLIILDGYRWRESDDPRGFTYCLFNSNKISKPNKTTIFKVVHALCQIIKRLL